MNGEPPELGARKLLRGEVAAFFSGRAGAEEDAVWPHERISASYGPEHVDSPGASEPETTLILEGV